MMVEFVDLPYEILELILSQTNIKDWLSVKRTNRTLYQIVKNLEKDLICDNEKITTFSRPDIFNFDNRVRKGKEFDHKKIFQINDEISDYFVSYALCCYGNSSIMFYAILIQDEKIEICLNCDSKERSPDRGSSDKDSFDEKFYDEDQDKYKRKYFSFNLDSKIIGFRIIYNHIMINTIHNDFIIQINFYDKIVKINKLDNQYSENDRDFIVSDNDEFVYNYYIEKKENKVKIYPIYLSGLIEKYEKQLFFQYLNKNSRYSIGYETAQDIAKELPEKLINFINENYEN